MISPYLFLKDVLLDKLLWLQNISSREVSGLPMCCLLVATGRPHGPSDRPLASKRKRKQNLDLKFLATSMPPTAIQLLSQTVSTRFDLYASSPRVLCICPKYISLNRIGDPRDSPGGGSGHGLGHNRTSMASSVPHSESYSCSLILLHVPIDSDRGALRIIPRCFDHPTPISALSVSLRGFSSPPG